MNSDKFTKLTIENSDNKIVWETPYEDVLIEDLIHAFVTGCIGLTWLPTTVYQGMLEYLEEHASDLLKDNE